MEYSLRDIQEEDLEMVLAWRNSDRIRAYMYTDQLISLEEHRSWYYRMLKNPNIKYKIFSYRDRPIGVVNFTDIDFQNRKSYWGFYLGETNVPKGSGTTMGFLALEYGFETMNLHKICGEAFGFNTSSINFHRRLGFLQEGHFKKHVLKNGVYQDIIVFAQLREDWQENKKLLEQIIREGVS